MRMTRAVVGLVSGTAVTLSRVVTPQTLNHLNIIVGTTGRGEVIPDRTATYLARDHLRHLAHVSVRFVAYCYWYLLYSGVRWEGKAGKARPRIRRTHSRY